MRSLECPTDCWGQCACKRLFDLPHRLERFFAFFAWKEVLREQGVSFIVAAKFTEIVD